MDALIVRAASVAMKLRRVRGDNGYFGHLHDLISAAHDEGASLVVLPELHVLELLPLAKELDPAKAARYLVQYEEALEDWLRRIAANSGMTIVGGSHFKKSPTGIRNVGMVAYPDGTTLFGEKNNLTGYERDVWQLEPGRGLTRFDPVGGLTICYDCEFPEAGRALAEAGMLLHCVPSWTESQRGFQRVRWSCLARAVENQTFVIHSALLGDLGTEPVPGTYGSSAIIAPSVEPFPVAAILRETPLQEEGVIVADLDFDQLAEARRGGDVANWADRSGGDWTVTLPPSPPAADSGPYGSPN